MCVCVSVCVCVCVCVCACACACACVCSVTMNHMWRESSCSEIKLLPEIKKTTHTGCYQLCVCSCVSVVQWQCSLKQICMRRSLTVIPSTKQFVFSFD